MRYMTLAEMLDAVRIEARISQSAAHGLTLRDPHTYLLNRIQDDLFLTYDWPSLKVNTIIDVNLGQRYIAYPDGTNFESIAAVYAPDTSGRYFQLTQGIGPEQINFKNPDDPTQKFFPVTNYQNYIPATGATLHNMLEIWPVPDRATKLYFKGTRVPTKMTADADVSTIDGPAIVLHAAAEILAGQKAEDAALKLNKAQERVRLLRLRQAASNNKPTNLAGDGKLIRPLRPGIDYMPMK